MKILITGGAGFIGSHLVDAYISCGYKVIVVDDLSSGKKEFISDNVKLYVCDIRNSQEITNIIKNEKPDIVSHYASKINIKKSIVNPGEDVETNIIGTLNIIQACAGLKLKKIIFASSGGALYEEKKISAKENDSINPITSYGISKYSAEKYIKIYADLYSIPYVIFRYSNVYGPRQLSSNEGGVVPIFIKSILNNCRPKIFGTGNQTRDFIFVSDVIKANLLVTENDFTGIFNIGTNKETSINELYKIISKKIKSNLKPIYVEESQFDKQRSSLNYNYAKKTINWKPIVSLEMGIYETIKTIK